MSNSVDFLDFIIRSAIIWSVIFYTYKLTLSKSRWHKVNRIILIILLFTPFLLPYINWGVISAHVPYIETLLLPEIDLSTIEQNQKSTPFNWLYLYGLISIFFLFKYGKELYNTLKLKAHKPFFYYKNHKIYILEDDTAFNFLNQIYVGKTLKKETSVLDHEIIHKKARHSLDLLLITLLRSVFWIFPFWKMVIKLFKENHEYYVDQQLLQTIKLSDYLKQISLAGPFKFEEQFSLTSNQMSIFKTRLQMMKNNHKSQFWRYLLMLGISGAILTACDKTNTEMDVDTESNLNKELPPPPPPMPPLPINPSNEESVNIAEADMFPTWKGCQESDAACFQQAMTKHIVDNFKYPKRAKLLNEEGKAFVGFQISTRGEIKNISLIRKTKSEDINQEAIRLVKSLPKAEKPAYKDGKPVAVAYVLPINFKLK